MKPQFNEKDFPDNLLSTWTDDFGHLNKDHAIVIGEWGGHFSGKDEVWQKRMMSFMNQHRIGHFYWSLNPNSGDTGGLLQDDWKTPSTSKLDLLSSCESTQLDTLL